MKKGRMTVLLVFILVQTAFIWTNSVLSQESSGQMSGELTSLIKDMLGLRERVSDEFLHHIIRKTAHFTEFFILGALYTMIRACLPVKIRSALLIFPAFATLATAVTDEFIQLFTNRGSSVSDVVLDFCGALCAIIIFELVIYLYRTNKALKRGEGSE